MTGDAWGGAWGDAWGGAWGDSSTSGVGDYGSARPRKKRLFWPQDGAPYIKRAPSDIRIKPATRLILVGDNEDEVISILLMLMGEE